MKSFLTLERDGSPGWLSQSPPEASQYQNFAEQKRVMRKNLRCRREKLKNQAIEAGLPWGSQHLSVLEWFLFQHQIGSERGAAQPALQTIASYWPIGSELKLLPDISGQSQPRSEASDGNSRLKDRFQWILPATVPQHTLKWFQLSPEVAGWPRDPRGLPIPADVSSTQDFPQGRNTPWVVLTPCLAVDRTGTRLGYGGGYYDRFLSKHGSHCLIIACVPKELFLENDLLPFESHDVKVDLIITEDAIFEPDAIETQRKLKLFLSCSAELSDTSPAVQKN